MFPVIELNDLRLPWGTTLDEAAPHLAGWPHYPTYGSRPDLRVACHRAYGLATTEASLRSPATFKPIMQVSYELAAAGLPAGLAAPDPWLPALTERFGVLTEGGSYPEARGQASSVVWAGCWQLLQLRVSLSVFGGRRESPGGAVLAGLFLDWEDELTAARPWVQQARAEGAALAATASQGSALLTVQLRHQPGPAAGANLSPAADALRQAQRALHRQGLCDTPPHWQQQLGREGQVLLWELPARAGWAVSTWYDTVLLPAAAPPCVELQLIRPAKGSGGIYLDVDGLSLRDSYNSRALPTLADRLATLPGVVVGRYEDSDC